MEKNSWKVCRDVQLKVDVSPVMSDFVTAYVTIKSSDSFFFNKLYFEEYNSKSQKAKDSVPGSGYMNLIWDFHERQFLDIVNTVNIFP